MCGIVAASSRRNITPILLEGLRRLEYRGYDSCGIAVIESDGAFSPGPYGSARCEPDPSG